MFSVITPAFLDRLLYFLYKWKQEWILYNIRISWLDDVITASHRTSQNLLHRVKDEHWTNIGRLHCVKEKRPLLFWLLLWRFLLYFYSFCTNKKWILYIKVNTICNIIVNCASTLHNIKQQILRPPWPTASFSGFDRTGCSQRLLAESRLMFVFFIFEGNLLTVFW